jgi:hypothetical protein
MIEKSGIRQNKRSDTGGGNMNAFGMPLLQMCLELMPVSPLMPLGLLIQGK